MIMSRRFLMSFKPKKEFIIMVKLTLLSMLFFSFCTVYSQDCCDKLGKQAIFIDSLQKVVKANENHNRQIINETQSTIKALSDSIKILRSELLNLDRYRKDKRIIDDQLKLKNDSIALLKNQITYKNQEIDDQLQKCEKEAQEEKEKGRNEALADVVNSYKNKPFDNLINSSTRLSVQRDLQLVGHSSEIASVLTDLEKFFNAEELLTKNVDADKIKDALKHLDQIKRNAELLDILKENIEFYEDFNNALKDAIRKIINLDSLTSAVGVYEIQKLKFSKIVTILTDYMYNYYDYNNYPYLSDILLEIIKRKRLNADADITDLLQKLE